MVNGLSTGEFSLAGANEISLALGVVARIGQLLDPLTGILSDSALAAPYVRESAWLLSPSLLSDRLLERVLDCQKQVQDWKALLGPEVMDSVTHPEDLRSRPGMLVRTDLLEPELAKEILALAPALHSVMEGVLVHGDNLGALRLMTPTMRERVHVSYIDPPYNTGNASVYIYADSRERSAWAAQIHSRLTHARRLLREDGVLWSSIDDNEAHTLRFLLDSTMGAEQFISTISWRKKVVRGRGAQHVLPQTEYVHAYGKNAKELPAFFEPLTDEMIKAYRWEDEQGPYKRIPLAKTGTSQSPRPNLVYPIEAPDGSMIPCPTHQWRWSKQTLRDRFDEIEFVQKRDGGWTIFTKQRLYVDGEQRRRTPCSYYDRVTTTDGTREIKELFGSVVADFPKPTRLLRDLLSWPGQPSTGEDVAYYLDFFAGSGSTAHAVMEENRSDDVQRRSLMIEAGFHFDTVLLPRIQKLAYSMEWKKGRPGVVSERETAFQVLRLACFDDVLERQVQIYLGESVDGLSVNELETGLWNLGVHTEHRLRVEGVDIVLGRNQNGDAVAVLWSDSVVAASSVAAAARIAKSKGAMEIFPHASLSIPRSLHGKCHVWNADTRVDNVDSPVGTRSIPAIA